MTTSDLLSGFEIQKQGDFDVEVIRLATRKVGFRHWYVQTSEKRPDGMAFISDWSRPHYIDVFLMNRTYGDEIITMHFKEGQTGQEQTFLRVRVPRPFLPWRQWRVEVLPDKWGVEVIAYTTSWPGEFWSWKQDWKSRIKDWRNR